LPDLTPTEEPTRDDLIVSFRALAKHIARKYRHWSLDPADLAQTAVLGVITAVDSYAAVPLGPTLAQYVACRIKWACADAVKKARSDTRDREDADLSLMAAPDYGTELSV
jgi:RNA polymerase sigma factor (sigma-70 family)